MVISRMDSLESASNALRLTEILGERGTITVTEASRSLGIGKSTAHRLLMTLVAQDFAERRAIDRSYHVGPALTAAGLSAVWDFDVHRHARPIIEDLARCVNETVKLLVLDGRYARVLESAIVTGSVRVGGSIGNLLPANATAAGKVLLCRYSEDELRHRFGGRLRPVTDRTLVDWDYFMVELQRVRSRGWAASVGESTNGVVGLAVPVLDRFNEIAGALALAGRESRMPGERHRDLIAHLTRSAARIRMVMGFGMNADEPSRTDNADS